MSGAAQRVAVVGGGIIGLTIAWRLAGRGIAVTLWDPSPGSGASGVAAGMLGATGEAHFGEQALTALLVHGAGLWPGFAAELTAATGLDLGYRDTGTLLLARTRDDLAEVDRLLDFQAATGLPVTRLRADALREREPLLTPRLRGGALLADDHQVDPRRVLRALLRALADAGVPVRREPVTELSTMDYPTVVLAAGWASAALGGLPVRPVKGQLLRLRAPRDGTGALLLRHVLRGYVDGRRVYLVPRTDGEVVVGATSEERADATVTAGAVLDLLRAATDLVPGLAEYQLAEVLAGRRPGTPDNAPIIGELRPGVLVATGHYRHGVLLAPATAAAIVDLLITGVLPEPVRGFGPDRFAATGVGSATGVGGAIGAGGATGVGSRTR